MRRTIFAAVATGSLLALSVPALAATAGPSTSAVADQQPASYVVVLDDSATARTVATGHADRFGFDLGHVYTSALQGTPPR